MKKLKMFDPSRYLETPEDIAYYLEDSIETGDTKIIAAALGDVAKAIGITQIAEQTGVNRASLYKSLLETDNSELSALQKVASKLEVKFQASSALSFSKT